MKQAWPIVKLGEVLTPVQRAVEPVAGTMYRQLGVRLWGEGTYEREPVDGAQTTYSYLFRAETDDVIVNKIWARNGSVALVQESQAGCYGSTEFPMFAPNQIRLVPRWIHWLTKTRDFWVQCDEKSKGTSGKNRIKPSQFLNVEIPLPSVAEQRRIVARIDELAAHIQEAHILRQQSVEESNALCRSILASDMDAKPTPMRDLVKLLPPDVCVQANETYPFAGVYCFGRGVFKAHDKSGMDFAYPRLTRLKTGNFVYPKLMAWEGAFGVVPPECDGCVVSTEFPVFEVIEDRVLPEVLDTYFRTPSVWPAIAGASTGTNVRRRRLNPSDFLDYRIPLPSMAVQLKLRAVRAQVDALKRLQSETTAELDALMPSILDRAFKRSCNHE
jgi:type I restriction enzyme S subunit